jgi:hypothetical protein
MKLKNIVKKADMFGRPISFNFEKEGEFFNTVTGGIVSILFILLITSYSIKQANVLFFHDNDINFSI